MSGVERRVSWLRAQEENTQKENHNEAAMEIKEGECFTKDS